VKHVLKSLPEPFADVLGGAKRFEFRRDDRSPAFAVADELELNEYDPEGAGVTGRAIDARVCYVMRGGFGLPEGFAILGLDCVRPRLDTLDEDRKLVARLAELDEGLTDWEADFIESLIAWVGKGPEGQKLTDKQRERAIQIDETM
jgi:hypothetical protein